MSPYERDAWAALQEQAKRREKRQIIKPETRRKLGSKASGFADRVRKAPGMEFAEQAVMQALEGLRSVTMDAAMQSVSEKRVLRRFESRAGVHVNSLSAIRGLDLEVCDTTAPALRLRYTTATAAEGAASSLAITGAEVATTVSGGATSAVVVGAIAADTAVVLAAMGRVVAETAAYYGFDASAEDEQLFALAIISYSSATTQPAKIAAMAELSRLTQMMMRRATWPVLANEPLVKVIQHIYARLGLRLTKSGLGRAVPVAGVIIGAGINAAALNRISRDAKFAYRMRFLATKYGLDPSEMVDFADADVTDMADEDAIRFELPSAEELGEYDAR